MYQRTMLYVYMYQHIMLHMHQHTTQYVYVRLCETVNNNNDHALRYYYSPKPERSGRARPSV